MGRQEKARSPSHRVCRNCGKDITHRDYRAKNCSEKCKNEYNYRNKNISKSQRLLNHIKRELDSINLANFILLKGKKKGICVYCDSPFNQDTLKESRTRDHFIPKVVARGTRATFKNAFYSLFTVNSCYECNNLKADMMPTEFRDFIMNSEHEKKDNILYNLNTVLSGH